MAYSIIWSDAAETELDKIFEYYSEKAGLRIALAIIQKILFEADMLLIDPETYPLVGALLNREETYRFIICGNYKLIYSVDEPTQLIKIADVFDTRQSPFKIMRTK
ncbi:type II toxin-antitoxin system RelE/ParE family toxin [Flavobacterium sp. MFBS3-15]|uniref:type II toxin-antitoxin system RelE/ParE family toxin n=1 Tax=Flavobacterium sp. MFBS3-15 TaxID=2989816 RepID=UPI002236B5D3|nr:type II toxin-antitoxin system RelE/ParE family toxin [Flavobacterium sp. MFBS3-15]MCW4470368.1 type II toxin-antitoxin system RelE/ParE family toxin [Flavobacterium sp. MFBS3-15]